MPNDLGSLASEDNSVKSGRVRGLVEVNGVTYKVTKWPSAQNGKSERFAKSRQWLKRIKSRRFYRGQHMMNSGIGARDENNTFKSVCECVE